jgi:hypothetical protein
MIEIECKKDSFTKPDDLIILLAKFPTKGVSKTRLYDSIGIENAHLLSIAMLSDLLSSLNMEIGKKVLYIPKHSVNDGIHFSDNLNYNDDHNNDNHDNNNNNNDNYYKNSNNNDNQNNNNDNINTKDKNNMTNNKSSWSVEPMGGDLDLRSSDLGIILKYALCYYKGHRSITFIGMYMCMFVCRCMYVYINVNEFKIQ